MAPDPDVAALLALRVWQYKQGEMVSLMIHLGDRLGLYAALDGAGAVSPATLAERTGLQERWLREWLLGQAAAGLLEIDPDGPAPQFRLSAEAALVLAREDDSLLFAAGAFSGGAATPEVVDALVDAFRTGRGLTYDQQGPSAAHQTERMLAPWARLALVPTIVPALDGVEEVLRSGARVLDVGCGAGVAVFTLAEAYPSSQFLGVDPSRLAIERAAVRGHELGLTNVKFSNVSAEQIESEGAYDLVLTFDCLHDMTHPERAVAAIGRALRPGGTWLIREIRSAGSWEGNLRNPVLAMLYASSVSCCMSSALSEPGGAGLGTLGLPPPAVDALCRAGGFGHIVEHDFDDPANLYYEVRR